MSDVSAALREAVEASTPLDAVLALVRAWKVAPSTRIAQCCRQLALSLREEAVEGANQTDREAAWHALASGKRSEDLGRLLLTGWSRNARDARARLEVLRSFGPDPRVVGALLELDTGERYLNAEGNRFWAEVYELLLSWGSVEAVQRIPSSPASLTSPLALARYQAVFEPLVVRWRTRWPKEPWLSADDVKALEALEGRGAQRQRVFEGLLAAVHAAPDDLNPRLVLADALTEAGDARGEFISLQLAHAAGNLTMGLREKMALLARSSAARWLDGLERQVAPEAVFHQGFATEVRLATREPDPQLAAWRLVESLDLAGLALPLSQFLAHPNLAKVRRLTNLSTSSLAELVRAGAPRAWQCLELEPGGGAPVAAPAWTVERLRVPGFLDQSLFWFARSAFSAQVRTVEFALSTGFDRVGPTLSALWDQTSNRAVDFVAHVPAWPERPRGRWAVRLTRERPRVPARAVIEVYDDEALEELKVALSSLGPGAVHEARAVVWLKRPAGWRTELQRQAADALGCPVTVEAQVAAHDAPLIWKGT